MTHRIGITGLGLCTPLGDSAWATWRALLAGRCLTDRCERCAEGIDPTDLVRSIGGVRAARGGAVDPAVELAERAARQAVAEAGAERERMPTILAASKGAVADAPRSLARGPVDQLAADLARRMPVDVTRQVVAACASSLVGLHLARCMLRFEREVSRVLVVSSEAALDPIFIHSYRRLGVLPTLTPEACRALPLDRRRCGFIPAEVGAAVVLERFDDGAVAANAPLAWLADSAVACEAHDLVRAGPRKALEHVARRLFGEPVDLLHPHATGTRDNDESELAVYARILGAAAGDPDVYAVKGALGHGLGAAGLTALVLAVLAGRTNRRPPMKWLNDPIDSPLALQVESPGRAIRRQALFSAGFGGHVAGAVIASP